MVKHLKLRTSNLEQHTQTLLPIFMALNLAQTNLKPAMPPTGRKLSTARSAIMRKWPEGRKRNRCTGQALLRYFKSGNSNLSAYRLRQELKYFLAYTQWQTVPSGQLIVIADEFYARVAKRRFTAYITLLRPVNGTEAVILPPTMHEGVETYMGWRSHFATLPKSVSRRLVAGVCDGRTGLIALFRERNLLLQRCHFHFIARLQIKRSKRRSSHHYEIGR